MGRIKGVIFDLDDTLYNERKFVESGFKTVANVIEKKFSISSDEFYSKLIEILEKEGRGRNFDLALKKFSIYNEKLVKRLVDVYRSHIPDIIPYSDTIDTLKSLRKQGIKIGLITDGLSRVQRIKVYSLGIEDFFNAIVYTDDYGERNWKPNTFPYKKILKLLKLTPKETVYVGDNPEKDFIGARKSGIITIRILRGQYKNLVVSKDYDADYSIGNLVALLQIIDKI